MIGLEEIDKASVTDFSRNNIFVDSDVQNALTKVSMSVFFKHLFRELGFNREALTVIKASVEERNSGTTVKAQELEKFLLKGA